jgi:hypothetical protein
MRKIARTDRNQQELMDTARAVGCTVHDTHQLGGGFPDFLMFLNGKVLMIEVKDGDKPPSAQALTKQEEAFQTKWWSVYYVVSTVDMLLQVIAANRKS